MAGFGDTPLVGPGSELQLTIDGRAVAHTDVVAAAADALTPTRAGDGAGEENLFAVGALLAARAATPATRRQYASIYRSFGDWLMETLGPRCSDFLGREKHGRRHRREAPYALGQVRG